VTGSSDESKIILTTTVSVSVREMCFASSSQGISSLALLSCRCVWNHWMQENCGQHWKRRREGIVMQELHRYLEQSAGRMMLLANVCDRSFNRSSRRKSVSDPVNAQVCVQLFLSLDTLFAFAALSRSHYKQLSSTRRIKMTIHIIRCDRKTCRTTLQTPRLKPYSPSSSLPSRDTTNPACDTQNGCQRP